LYDFYLTVADNQPPSLFEPRCELYLGSSGGIIRKRLTTVRFPPGPILFLQHFAWSAVEKRVQR
jgi:hypothetical protein